MRCEKTILEILNKKGPATVEEFGIDLQQSTMYIQRVLYQLRAEQKVMSSIEKPYKWSLIKHNSL